MVVECREGSSIVTISVDLATYLAMRSNGNDDRKRAISSRRNLPQSNVVSLEPAHCALSVS